MRQFSRRYFQAMARRRGVYCSESEEHRQAVQQIAGLLQRGEPAYIVGITPCGHNTGVSLVRASHENGIELLSNDEEERLQAVKHCDRFPERALDLLRERLKELKVDPADVAAWVTGWDYVDVGAMAIQSLCEEFPSTWPMLHPETNPTFHFFNNVRHPRLLGRQLKSIFDMPTQPRVVMSPHHENHAYLSFAGSPFAIESETADCLVLVLDGLGDRGAISCFRSSGSGLKLLYCNRSISDSLGAFYSIISSTQGGWTTLSSEGRYMGATAWGDGDRLTNPFYKHLRQMFHFGSGGEFYINRQLANWHTAGEWRPYKRELSDLIGPPIARNAMWNPDAVLNVANVEHSPITKRRVDLAAATQLVFEDVMFHVLDHWLRETGCHRLLLSGGTALNAICNMRILDRYDQNWFERNLGQSERLRLWIPPIPGDAGIAAGAAMRMAVLGGGKSFRPLSHAFYCGTEASCGEIEAALDQEALVHYEVLGSTGIPEQKEEAADLLAQIIVANGVVGLYQGVAETGPRALGHRSILANPANPSTLDQVNRLVKFREPIRPLAPMVTFEQAENFFELSEGAALDDYNAYRYMVITCRAKPEALKRVPAVVHLDGTSRIQIVRRQDNPFTHCYLQAMGRRIGAEVSVNTSLNVGSPIAQSPVDAVRVLMRAKAMTALVLISREGTIYIAWKAHQNQSSSSLPDWKEMLA